MNYDWFRRNPGGCQSIYQVQPLHSPLGRNTRRTSAPGLPQPRERVVRRRQPWDGRESTCCLRSAFQNTRGSEWPQSAVAEALLRLEPERPAPERAVEARLHLENRARLQCLLPSPEKNSSWRLQIALAQGVRPERESPRET